MNQHQVNQFIAEAGGFFSGAIRINGALYGVITAPKAEAGSPIAQKALGTTINGFSDWVIPARDVLEIQYRAHKPTTETNYVYRSGDNPSSVPAGYPYTEALPAQCPDPLFQEGGAEAFDAAWYLSSTQSSPYDAWYQNFDVGNQYDIRKTSEGVVRLVRRFFL